MLFGIFFFLQTFAQTFAVNSLNISFLNIVNLFYI